MLIFPRPVCTPRPPRRERPQRVIWSLNRNTSPYLIANPGREIAAEVNGFAHCPACGETYTPRLFERIVSPSFLRAQRWAHAHNAERHPRRWLRSQHFQAPIPAEVRERAVTA